MEDENKTKNMVDSYNELIMLDFRHIVENKPNELAFFLNEPEALRPGHNCNMELEIISNRLAKFSTDE